MTPARPFKARQNAEGEHLAQSWFHTQALVDQFATRHGEDAEDKSAATAAPPMQGARLTAEQHWAMRIAVLIKSTRESGVDTSSC